MDGEVGRFEFLTHSVINNGQTCFNTASDIFSELKPKQFYRTIGFKEIGYIYGDTEQSYRKTAKLINRIRYQEEEGTPYRTLQENTEKEGAKIVDYIDETSKLILKQNGFSEDGICHDEQIIDEPSMPDLLQTEQIDEAIVECMNKNEKIIFDDIISNPVCYEDPAKSINVSIDDVIVKKQHEDRPNNNKENKRKYIHNTVIHAENCGNNYTLNGYGIKNVLRYLIALIFNSDLVGHRFQFFTDGHTMLNEAILKIFSWYNNLGIILDWYHLEKKCKEQLSLALNGRDSRNLILENLMPILWVGGTDRAIAFLENISGKFIKNNDALHKLILYLERNKPYIPCYVIRKELGLRNSSNIGEKMNDILVSKRQKDNGMSWSKQGSVALASITALKHNKESKKWFEERELDFQLAA